MLLFIVSILLIQTIACIYKPAWGLSFYILVRLMIPPIARVVMLDVSLNTFCLIIILSSLLVRYFFLKKSINIPAKKQYNFILIFIISLFTLGLFANLSFSIQASNFIQFILTELIPYFVVLMAIKNNQDLKIVVYSLLIGLIISGVYGIFTYIASYSPIYSFFSIYFDARVDFTDQDGNIRGGLSGAAVGPLSGPLPWGQLVLLGFAFFSLDKRIKVPHLTKICVILTLFNCFLCGKRSVIIPALFIVFILLKQLINDKQKIVYLVFSIVCMIVVVNEIPALQSYSKNIETALFFWDDKLSQQNNIGGSSVSMRQEQFEYSLGMIQDSPIQGLGLCYPEYYGKQHGNHPVMLGFESLFFYVILSSGYLGLIIWSLFFVKFYNLTSKGGKHTRFIARIFIISYLMSLFLTSIQASFYFFMIIGALLVRIGAMNNTLYNENKFDYPRI